MNLYDTLLFIFILAGIIGSLFPAVPGTSIIVAGALLHGWLTGFDPIGWLDIVILASLSLATWVGQYLLAGIGSKKFGASKYGVIGASIGMVIGLFLPIFGGMILGTFLGAFLAEICFAVKDIKQGAWAGTGALLGVIASLFLELFVAFAMAWFLVIKII